MSATPPNGKSAVAFWVAVLVPAFSFLAALVGVIWQLASVAFSVTDMSGKVAALQIQREADRQEIARLRIDSSEQKAALLEIETQFCERDHLSNLTHASDLRWFAMLWSKTFGQTLPTDNAYYPTVCNRKPRQ